jgi:hypothetical protein
VACLPVALQVLKGIHDIAGVRCKDQNRETEEGREGEGSQVKKSPE